MHGFRWFGDSFLGATHRVSTFDGDPSFQVYLGDEGFVGLALEAV